MSHVVLDSGAPIALERNDRGLGAALKVAARENADVLMPASVLTRARAHLVPSLHLRAANEPG